MQDKCQLSLQNYSQICILYKGDAAADAAVVRIYILVCLYYAYIHVKCIKMEGRGPQKAAPYGVYLMYTANSLSGLRSRGWGCSQSG